MISVGHGQGPSPPQVEPLQPTLGASILMHTPPSQAAVDLRSSDAYKQHLATVLKIREKTGCPCAVSCEVHSKQAIAACEEGHLTCLANEPMLFLGATHDEAYICRHCIHPHEVGWVSLDLLYPCHYYEFRVNVVPKSGRSLGLVVKQIKETEDMFGGLLLLCVKPESTFSDWNDSCLRGHRCTPRDQMLPCDIIICMQGLVQPSEMLNLCKEIRDGKHPKTELVLQVVRVAAPLQMRPGLSLAKQQLGQPRRLELEAWPAQGAHPTSQPVVVKNPG